MEKELQLIAALSNKCKDSEMIFLTISGDFANTGSKAEFKIAFDFLNRIKSALENYCGKNN